MEIREISIAEYNTYMIQGDTVNMAEMRKNMGQQMKAFAVEEGENVDVIGVVIRDKIDEDFAYIVSRRNKENAFEVATMSCGFWKIDDVCSELQDVMKKGN